jgi:SAM-dependent methyltransferase
MRVLLLPCRTGFAAAMVSGRVAPSGSVVALDSDEGAIEFARLRYPIQNLAFERGGLPDIAGETDGAFDAVLSIAVRESGVEAEQVAELWRLVAPGGWLLIASRTSLDSPPAGAPHSTQPEELADLVTEVCAPLAVPAEATGGERSRPANIAVLGDGVDGWAIVLARRADPLDQS